MKTKAIKSAKGGMWRTLMLLSGSAMSMLTTTPSRASEQQGNVTFIAAGGGPNVVLVSGSRTAKPPCATDDAWTVIDQYSLENAQIVNALALVAYTMGRVIRIAGTGTCTVFPNREDVSFVVLQ